MAEFTARSTLPARVEDVFAWHTRPGAFERLQPPWDVAEITGRMGEGLAPGTRVEVRIHLGPVPRRLVVEHTRLEPNALFEDVQREGPFAHWTHQHRFHAIDETTSLLEDHVDYALPLGGAGRLFGAGSVRDRLEGMFRYRHRLLRADLERHARAGLPPLTVLIAGASGMIGSALTHFLTTGGHTVHRLVRRATSRAGEFTWDPSRQELDPRALEGVDAVISLSGANLAEGRWTEARKHLLRESRLDPTLTLAGALARHPTGPRGPRTWISVSGAGIYGHTSGDVVHTEASPPGDDFLAQLCIDWEKATQAAQDAGVRVTIPRLGPVISARGGMVAKLRLPFLLGGGGRLGSGTQWLSWTSLEDVLGAFLLALSTPALRGPFNLVSPLAVTNAQFTRTLARVLHRPAILPLPGLALKGALGELGEAALLGGQCVAPTVLERHGFTWLLPDLEEALRYELGRAEGPSDVALEHA
jgi:uncharacterized protein (TIGR01777 family)